MNKIQSLIVKTLAETSSDTHAYPFGAVCDTAEFGMTTHYLCQLVGPKAGYSSGWGTGWIMRHLRKMEKEGTVQLAVYKNSNKWNWLSWRLHSDYIRRVGLQTILAQ